MTKDSYCISSTDYKESDPSVQTLADYTISCADHARLPAHPYKVGPMGQLISSPIPIQVIFVYPPPPRTTAQTEVLPTAQLRAALARALDDYPHLTGRLVCGPHGTLTVEHFDTGALLREARCSHTLASLAGRHREERTTPTEPSSPSSSLLSLMDLPGGGNALFPPLPLAPDAVAAAPTLVVQQTRFACGGVALAIRIMHVLCDGAGFFQFSQDLVRFCHVAAGDGPGVPGALPPPPQLTPYLSEFSTLASSASLAAARAYEPPLMHLAPLPSADAPEPVPPPPPEVQGRELYFTAAQLAAIKQQCTRTGEDAEGSWVSTFEALGAFLAAHIYQVRQQRLPCSNAHDYLSPVDIRTRVLPSAAEAARYFPVGSISACGALPDEALTAGGALPTVAAAIHAIIRSPHLTTERLQHQLRWVAAQPDPSRVRSNFAVGGFMLSAWNKFDMYDAMRLCGVAPVFVGTPFTQISLLDGLAYVLPHPRPLFSASASSSKMEGEEAVLAGSLVVVVALNALLWEALSTEAHLGPYMRR